MLSPPAHRAPLVTAAALADSRTPCFGACQRTVPGPRRIAALHAETLDNPMEYRVVVVTLQAELRHAAFRARPHAEPAMHDVARWRTSRRPRVGTPMRGRCFAMHGAPGRSFGTRAASPSATAQCQCRPCSSRARPCPLSAARERRRCSFCRTPPPGGRRSSAARCACAARSGAGAAAADGPAMMLMGVLLMMRGTDHHVDAAAAERHGW